MSTRTNGRRRVAVARELAGDSHPYRRRGRHRTHHRGRSRRRHRGARSVRPMRLMSDSVLHLSDNRSAALQEAVGADTGLGWRARVARWRRIASRRCPRSRDLNAIRLIRRIGGLIDSAAASRRSITTASRNAVNREPGSAHGVVARAGLAALRTAGLAAVLGGDLGRAGHDDGRRGRSYPHESLKALKKYGVEARLGSSYTSSPTRSWRNGRRASFRY